MRLFVVFFLEADQKDPLHLMQISGPLDSSTGVDEHKMRLLLPKLDEHMHFCVCECVYRLVYGWV